MYPEESASIRVQRDMIIPRRQVLLGLEVPLPRCHLDLLEGVQDHRVLEDVRVNRSGSVYNKSPLVAIDDGAREDAARLEFHGLNTADALEEKKLLEEEVEVLEGAAVVFLERRRGKLPVEEGREVAVSDDGEDLVVSAQDIAPETVEFRPSDPARDVPLREGGELRLMVPEGLEDRPIKTARR